MEAHRKQYSKGGTIWDDNFDAMAKKTVLRQLISKWGIISSEIETALTNDMTEPENTTVLPPQFQEITPVHPQIQAPIQSMPDTQGHYIPQETAMTEPYMPPAPSNTVVSLDDL